MTIDEAIAVFDKSAYAQTEAWAVIRAELANPDRLQVTNMLVLCGEREVRGVYGLPQKLRALIDGLITQRQRAEAAEARVRDLEGALRSAPGGHSCEEFHHSKADRHHPDEPCPPMERWHQAVAAIATTEQAHEAR